jgi:hypothetical protein
MELLGDVVHVEFRFGLFSLCQTYYRFRKRFGRTQWYSKVTRLKWKLISVHLEIALNLTQNRCMVYAKRNIGLENVLDQADGTPR